MRSLIHIDAARPDDAEAIAAVYRPYVLDTAITFETTVPSADQMRERMRSGPGLWLVARAPAGGGANATGTRTEFEHSLKYQSGDIVGYAYAGPHRTRAAYRWARETSVYLHPDAHGRGVGSALYRALFSLLPALGVQTALAGVALPNPASVALHRRFGFTDVGTYRRVGFKAGAFWDVVWMERLIGASDAPPAPPVCWADLSPAEQAALWTAHIVK